MVKNASWQEAHYLQLYKSGQAAKTSVQAGTWTWNLWIVSVMPLRVIHYCQPDMTQKSHLSTHKDGLIIYFVQLNYGLFSKHAETMKYMLLNKK